MSWSYYTRDEAENQIGKRYRLEQPFFGVPAGTTGSIVGLSSRYGEFGDYGVVVRWDTPASAGASAREDCLTPAQLRWALRELD